MLWYSPRREWPLWLATAGTLHTVSGLWVGRPLLMASLFALFDVLLYPLCILALRTHPRQFISRAFCNPVAVALFQLVLLTVIIFSLSTLLTSSLLLAHYPVSFYHFVSWALAALTCIVALWPLLQAAPTSQRIRGCDYGLVALNVALLGLWTTQLTNAYAPGLLLLWLQFAALLLSSFILPSRTVAVLLLLQFSAVVYGTLQGNGLFYSLAPSPLIAIWLAEVYVVISSVTVTCVIHFMRVHHQHLSKLAGVQALMKNLAQSGSCLTFTLTMPGTELNWSAEPAHFFQGGHLETPTLTLLNAHCEPSFLADFNHWHREKNTAPFCQRIRVHQMNGETIDCLLVIQPLLAQSLLIGGLAQLPVDILPTLKDRDSCSVQAEA